MPGSSSAKTRGACHRARIRATRWLAMTPKHTFAPSPRHAPEALMNLPPKEGVGNAGCPPHPRPRVRLSSKKHTSKRVHRNHPAFPHAMVLTAYVELSPVTGLFCHRHPRI